MFTVKTSFFMSDFSKNDHNALIFNHISLNSHALLLRPSTTPHLSRIGSLTTSIAWVPLASCVPVAHVCCWPPMHCRCAYPQVCITRTALLASRVWCLITLTHIAHAPISTKRASYHGSHASSTARPTHSALRRRRACTFLFFGPILYMLLQISPQNQLSRMCHWVAKSITFLPFTPFSASHLFQNDHYALKFIFNLELTWSAMVVARKGARLCSQATAAGSSSTAPAVGQTRLVAAVPRAH
jgi:hypothetical protein